MSKKGNKDYWKRQKDKGLCVSCARPRINSYNCEYHAKKKADENLFRKGYLYRKYDSKWGKKGDYLGEEVRGNYVIGRDLETILKNIPLRDEVESIMLKKDNRIIGCDLEGKDMYYCEKCEQIWGKYPDGIEYFEEIPMFGKEHVECPVCMGNASRNDVFLSYRNESSF